MPATEKIKSISQRNFVNNSSQMTRTSLSNALFRRDYQNLNSIAIWFSEIVFQKDYLVMMNFRKQPSPFVILDISMHLWLAKRLCPVISLLGINWMRNFAKPNTKQKTTYMIATKESNLIFRRIGHTVSESILIITLRNTSASIVCRFPSSVNIARARFSLRVSLTKSMNA